MSSLIKIDEECLNNCIYNTSKLIEKNSKLVRTGKVRDVYETDDSHFILIASDRISAFDRYLTTIPYKGVVLHKVSRWWFNKTKQLVPNHVLDDRDERIMKVKKCKVFQLNLSCVLILQVVQIHPYGKITKKDADIIVDIICRII